MAGPASVIPTLTSGNIKPRRSEGYDDGSRNDHSTYTWDAEGRLTARTLPNGVTLAYSYDAASRLTALEYRRTDGTTIEKLTYGYDANGQIVERGSLNAVSQSETYLTAAYDAADRMSSITLNPGTAQQATYTLTYDSSGNLTAKTNSANPADRTTYTWDSRNRMTSLSAAG